MHASRGHDRKFTTSAPFCGLLQLYWSPGSSVLPGFSRNMVAAPAALLSPNGRGSFIQSAAHLYLVHCDLHVKRANFVASLQPYQKLEAASGLVTHSLRKMAARSPSTIDEAISSARTATKFRGGSLTLTCGPSTKLGSTRSVT